MTQVEQSDVPWICAECGKQIRGRMLLITPADGNVPCAYHDACLEPDVRSRWREAYRAMFDQVKPRGFVDPFFNRTRRGRGC